MRAALRRERRSFAMHLAEAHDSAGPKLVERREQVEADLHYSLRGQRQPSLVGVRPQVLEESVPIQVVPECSGACRMCPCSHSAASVWGSLPG